MPYEMGSWHRWPRNPGMELVKATTEVVPAASFVQTREHNDSRFAPRCAYQERANNQTPAAIMPPAERRCSQGVIFWVAWKVRATIWVP